MEHVLVVANQTLQSVELLTALRSRKIVSECAFRVLVPATALSQQEQAMAHAEHIGVFGETGRLVLADLRLHHALDQLATAGITATGEVGDPDPFRAVVMSVERRLPSEVIISTLPRRLSRWLAADLPHRVNTTLGLKVTHIETGQILAAVDHGARRRPRHPVRRQSRS